MYHLLRRIHLFTGLLLLVFVLMYFLSGYVLIHEEWFGKRESKQAVRTELLQLAPGTTDSTLPDQLKSMFGLRGQSSTPEHRKDGSIRINFSRPGVSFQMVIASDGKQITITQRQFGFSGLANGIHRLRGYQGGWAYWAWSLFYDLASLALIIFAITGAVLWYQSTTRHVAGWACLAASVGFTTAMILHLMLTR